MSNVRVTLEQQFSKLGRLLFLHKIKTILLVLLCTFLFISQIPKLKIDTSNEAYFLKNDSALVDYEKFREQFGRDESIILAIEPVDVFNIEFLMTLNELHQTLQEKVPFIEEMTSLINARHTYGDKDALFVEDLLQDWPKNQQDLINFRELVLSNPFYKNLLISENGKTTAIIIKPQVYLDEENVDIMAEFENVDEIQSDASNKKAHLSNPQFAEMAEIIRQIVADYEDDKTKIYISGFPAVVDAIDQGLKKTITTLVPISYVIIILFLFIMFRRMSGVIYPVIIVALGTLTTMGLFPILNISINNVSTIIPTFLTVVGVADAVHILAAFYQRYNSPGEHQGNKEEAIAYAMGHTALPVMMTSITTAAGLLSFSIADVAPVAEFGLIGALGVLVMFLYTIFLVPALLSLFPVTKVNEIRNQSSDVMGRCIKATADIACNHPRKIISISMIIVLIACVGVIQIKLSHNALKWFSEDKPIRVASEYIDKHLGGAMVLEIVIDTGEKNGLYDPVLLRQLDKSISYAVGLSNDGADITKGWSLSTIVKEINQALNNNNSAMYLIPDDRQLVAQELLLFEGSGSDDLEKMIDSNYQMVRLSLKARFRDAVEYQPLIKTIDQHFQKNFPNAKVTVTGEMSLLVKMISNTLTSMVKSYAISIIVITLLMLIFIGNFRLSLISMVPNLVPLFIVVGIGGWMKIPMDFSTILMGSVVIGLVVDDTIHFMHNLRRYLDKTNDIELAIHKTLQTAGRAIFITSVVLSMSFFSFLAAEMKNTQYFGLLTGSAVVLALIADFLLTPALMVLLFKKKSRPV